MQNVPKIVQARLHRAAAAAESHPDADLLTAFAEQSLGESERARVVKHLARCGDCRDVVALALPAAEAVIVPSSTGVARGGWLSWPVLRWGVVAAGIALVTSVGILQYRQRTQQNVALVAAPVQREEKVANTYKESSPPAAPMIAPQAEEMAKQAPTRRLAQPGMAVATNQPSALLNTPPAQTTSRHGSAAGIGSGTGGGVGGGVFRAYGAAPKSNPEQAGAADAGAPAAVATEAMPSASQNPTQLRVPAAAPPVAGRNITQMVEVQSESTQIVNQGQDQGQLSQNEQVELPSQKQPLNNLDVVKAKDSVPPPAQSSVVFAPTVSTPNVSVQNWMSSSPRWSVSATGSLQRSFDAGATWEDVNVNPTSLASAKRMESGTDQKETSQAKKVRKKDQATAVVTFRAVAAIGPEVWAGGSEAMLYHSLDSGIRWARVLPSEANTSLSGDIVAVEFSDSNHGRIATSSGEVWMTGDDGQTWHKQ